MKLRIYLFILLLPCILFSQERLILRADGKIISPGELQNYSSREVIPLAAKEKVRLKNISENYEQTRLSIDTLSYNVPPSVNFGFFGQDRMVQWFKAPCYLNIKSVGIKFAAIDTANTQVEVKIVKANWSREEFLNAGVKRWGYYQAEGNGYNNATAFLDDPDRTGDWINVSGDSALSPFGEDIWSDSGIGVSLNPVDDGKYNFISMDILGNEPYSNPGEVFGVVIKNRSASMDENRIGVLSDNTLGIPGFKYYANGRLDPPNDFGWWSRNYTWDIVVVAEISECPEPVLITVADLETTLSQEPRTVEATVINNYPEAYGEIDSVYLMYSIDEGINYEQIEMASIGDNNYSADIPGQSPGTHVIYFVITVNIDGRQFESWKYDYYVFSPASENLLVFNGFDKPSGYPQSYYFGYGDFENNSVINWEHDVWSYGKLTAELVENYRNIIEITTRGPNEINNDVIKTWLEGGGARNYMLAGDELLGIQSNWADTLEHSAGEFHYDILGIKTEYNDINYAVSGDQQKPSIVFPVSGSLLGDSLAALFASVGDTMWYNPSYEIGQFNWLDGVEFLDDVEVDMKGLGADGKEYDIAGHRTLSSGNKIVFLAYDPLSLDAPDSQYYWYGFASAAAQVHSLRWFGSLLT